MLVHGILEVTTCRGIYAASDRLLLNLTESVSNPLPSFWPSSFHLLHEEEGVWKDFDFVTHVAGIWGLDLLLLTDTVCECVAAGPSVCLSVEYG